MSKLTALAVGILAAVLFYERRRLDDLTRGHTQLAQTVQGLGQGMAGQAQRLEEVAGEMRGKVDRNT